MKKEYRDLKNWKNYICYIVRDLMCLEYRDLKKVDKLIKGLMQQKYDEMLKLEVE